MKLLTRLFVPTLIVFMIAACGGDGADPTTEGEEPAATSDDASAAPSTAVEEEPAESEDQGAESDGDYEWVDGVLQPLADGFPSDPLTIMVVDEPGSADGIYARHLQEALGDMSPVRVDVVDREDFTAFGTWEALQAVSQEPGGNEGYITVISTTPSDVVDFHMVPITDELGMTLEDRNAVISTEAVPYVIAQRADAPWGDTLDDLISYAQENPGEVRYVSRGVGAGLDIAMEHYMETFGIEVEKVIGGPQPESAAIVGAGEGDVTILTPDVAITHTDSGRLEVIMVGGNTAPEPWTDVAVAGDYGVGDVPWGANRVMSVTEETPDEHRDWLFELYSTAAETEAFQEQRSGIPGLSHQLMNHDEVQAMSQHVMDVSEPVIRRLGLHLDDQ